VDMLFDLVEISDPAIASDISRVALGPVIAIVTNITDVPGRLLLRKTCLELVKALNTQFAEAEESTADKSVAAAAFPTAASMHKAAVQLLHSIAPTGDFLIQMDLVELLISSVLILDPRKQDIAVVKAFGKPSAELFNRISPETFEVDVTRFLTLLNDSVRAVVVSTVRSIHLDDMPIEPPYEFDDGQITAFVCFNTASDTVTFPAQNGKVGAGNYDWIELDRSCVVTTALDASGNTLTLTIEKDFDPDKVSLPAGTEKVTIRLVEAVSDIPVLQDAAHDLQNSRAKNTHKVALTAHVSMPIEAPLHAPKKTDPTCAELTAANSSSESIDSFEMADDAQDKRYTPLQVRVMTPQSGVRGKAPQLHHEEKAELDFDDSLPLIEEEGTDSIEDERRKEPDATVPLSQRQAVKIRPHTADDDDLGERNTSPFLPDDSDDMVEPEPSTPKAAEVPRRPRRKATISRKAGGLGASDGCIAAGRSIQTLDFDSDNDNGDDDDDDFATVKGTRKMPPPRYKGPTKSKKAKAHQISSTSRESASTDRKSVVNSNSARKKKQPAIANDQKKAQRKATKAERIVAIRAVSDSTGDTSFSDDIDDMALARAVEEVERQARQPEKPPKMMQRSSDDEWTPQPRSSTRKPSASKGRAARGRKALKQGMTLSGTASVRKESKRSPSRPKAFRSQTNVGAMDEEDAETSGRPIFGRAASARLSAAVNRKEAMLKHPASSGNRSARKLESRTSHGQVRASKRASNKQRFELDNLTCDDSDDVDISDGEDLSEISGLNFELLSTRSKPSVSQRRPGKVKSVGRKQHGTQSPSVSTSSFCDTTALSDRVTRSSAKRKASEVSEHEASFQPSFIQEIQAKLSQMSKRAKVSDGESLRQTFSSAAATIHATVMSIFDDHHEEEQMVRLRHTQEMAALFKKQHKIFSKMKHLGSEGQILIRGLEENAAVLVQLEQYTQEGFPHADNPDAAALDLGDVEHDRIESCTAKLADQVKKSLGLLQADSKSRQKMHMMRMMAELM